MWGHGRAWRHGPGLWGHGRACGVVPRARAVGARPNAASRPAPTAKETAKATRKKRQTKTGLPAPTTAVSRTARDISLPPHFPSAGRCPRSRRYRARIAVTLPSPPSSLVARRCRSRPRSQRSRQARACKMTRMHLANRWVRSALLWPLPLPRSWPPRPARIAVCHRRCRRWSFGTAARFRQGAPPSPIT